MKRKGNLYKEIISIENLKLADHKARKGKSKQYGVKIHDKFRDENIEWLHQMLCFKTYQTSEYTTFKIFEPKERLVFKLPYYPDRITHHAILNILETEFVKTFTTDSYSCIKGKGIHAALNAVKRSLKDVSNTTYCLKLDIKKFYPSINHTILKALLRRKFKDQDLLWLLDEIIDSSEGLPIGNYLSQYFANFYLTYFDHWVKEQQSVKYYFRYSDDMIILSNSKQYLHRLRVSITEYMITNLNLEIKSNYQVFPVESRGIDFVGYRIYHTHVLMRKRIKQGLARSIKQNKSQASIASYKGWAKHANTRHLLKTLLNEKI